LKSYVIVGGGTAGWISAAILSNLFKHSDTTITVIESPDIPTVGVGEATIPSILDMLAYLGIQKEDFIANTDATFKLGIKFVDWRRLDHHYWHPFGAVGGKIDTLAFYHHWRKYADNSPGSQFTDFSPAVVMAKEHKFFISNPSKPDLFSSSDYALHFDAAKVASYLQRYAENHGARLISANVVSVDQSLDDNITSLSLDTGAVVNGDFFIDCSGQRGLLISGALNVRYEDWSHYLPVDRAVAMQTQSTGALPPYTLSRAHAHGWQWRIPLQTRTGNGYVYSSKFCDDECAINLLKSNVDGAMLTEPRVLNFTTGKREKMWVRNCLSVGLSSGFLEPLESTSIYLIMRAMLNFVQMLPSTTLHQATIDEFNRLMDIEFECIRDFIVLHYCVSERTDSEFWRWWQQADIPESLERKLDLFKAQGRLMRNDLDLFALDSWYSVLEGMGVQPEGYDPIVDLSAFAKVSQMLEQRDSNLKQTVAALPSHTEYLDGVRRHAVKLP